MDAVARAPTRPETMVRERSCLQGFGYLPSGLFEERGDSKQVSCCKCMCEVGTTLCAWDLLGWKYPYRHRDDRCRPRRCEANEMLKQS